jgi:hypothetical protein
MLVLNISIWFKKLEILPILSLYVYFLMLFVVDNWHYFQTNSSVHEINTRYNNHLYIPTVTPTAIQRGSKYCIKIFNKLPTEISVLKNDDNFQICFKEISSSTRFPFHRRIFIRQLALVYF